MDSVVLPARALGPIVLLVRLSVVPPGMGEMVPALPSPRRASVMKSLLSEVEYEGSRFSKLVSKDVTTSCEPVSPRVSLFAMLDHDFWEAEEKTLRETYERLADIIVWGVSLPAGLCGASRTKSSLLQPSCHVVMPASLATEVLVVALTQYQHESSRHRRLIKSACVSVVPARNSRGDTARVGRVPGV
jgi:hypothetical protein